MSVRNRWLLGSCILIICYLLLQFYPNAHSDYITEVIETEKAETDHEGPLVIAHGGAKKLFPENTILAFENSIEMGVDAIEMDIRLTADDVLCTVHDEDISHYTNHKGKVQDYTYDELSLFNFGFHFKDLNHEYSYRRMNEKLIPARVEELFKQYGNTTFYVLEMKENGERGKHAIKILYDLIVKYDLQTHCVVASFDYEMMEYFQKINDANIICAMDAKSSKDFVVANYAGYNFLQEYAMDGLLLPLIARDIQLDDWYLIYKIHKQGLFVFYWTIDDKEIMKELIDKEVDGIITDRPDLLLQLLNKKE